MNTSRDMESVNDVEVVSPKNNPARAKRTYAEITSNQQSGDHSESFLKLMRNTVLHHKIPYWNDNETEGDGNCFYNALIDQIKNNPGVYETLSENAKQCSTPSELRAAVIAFIQSQEAMESFAFPDKIKMNILKPFLVPIFCRMQSFL